MGVMGTLQCMATLIHMAKEIRRGCQQLEIVPGQGIRLVGPRQ
jgi:hypothetical protein